MYAKNILEPDVVNAIENELVRLSARIDAATHRQLTLIRDAHERDLGEYWGYASTAGWLSDRIGMSPGVARERIRIAGALGTLPRINEAFSKGMISFSKVRAVTRVATPENESDLLNLARECTAAELERVLRGLRQVRAEEMPQEKPMERYVRVRGNADGTSTVAIRMLPDEAAKVYECLQRVRAVLREETSSIGSFAPAARPRFSSPSATASLDASASGSGCFAARKETRDSPDLVDAMVRIADMVSAGDVPAETRKQVTGGDNADIVVHLEAGMLNEELDAKLEDGSRVPAETFRRVACDCGVHAVVEGEEGVIGVGRKTRSISPAVRRALRARDTECRFPGCTCRRYVQAHHIEHWVSGGPTDLGNLVTLCPFHHRLLHEGGFDVVAVEGGFEFRTPRGEVVQRPERVPAETRLDETFRDLPTDGDVDANVGTSRIRPFRLVEVVNVMASCVLTPEAELRRAAKELDSMSGEE